MSLQNRNPDIVVNTIQPHMKCQDRKNKQTQRGQIQTMEEDDRRTEVKLPNDHNAYRGKFLNILSGFRHMCDGHLGRLKQPSWNRTIFSRGMLNPFGIVLSRSMHMGILETRIRQDWRWTLLTQPKQNWRHLSCLHQEKTEHSDFAWTTACLQ